MDSYSTSKGSGVDLVLRGLHGAEMCYVLKFGFGASNNEAKYKVLLVTLKIAKDIRAERVQIFF